ncbi:MAG: succinyl-diaminopimelate desuccinylase [Pseudomonadota bacterium]
MTFDEPLNLAQALIARPSISPQDAGCQALLIDKLLALGFRIEKLDHRGVENLWARLGDQSPLFVFAGHTDVVPPGNLNHWTSDPFTPTVRGNKLYGRGAADMKSSIAAMVIAVEKFLATKINFKGSVAFLITSDEEAEAKFGTVKVVEMLQQRHEIIDYCLVGEATSEKKLGDIIKIGRRGSLSGKLTIHGKQGHIAYPDRAINPIHKFIPAMQDLLNQQWSKTDEHFQPTSLQFSNIHAGVDANNVIPNELNLLFNFRYNPQNTATELQTRFESILKKHELQYSLDWDNRSQSFLTKAKKLVYTASQAIEKITGITPKLSTSGGTSDARFIAPTGAEVIEFGPINASIHKIDEHVDIDDLNLLTEIYFTILTDLFS